MFCVDIFFLTKTIIPLAFMGSDSIAHSDAIDSEPMKARGIIVKYMPLHASLHIIYGYVGRLYEKLTCFTAKKKKFPEK